MKKNDTNHNDDAVVQKLLNHASLDELIRMKMEEEIQHEFENSQKISEEKIITNISEVPVDMIFSKHAVYKVFNRINKVQTYVNGLQAEAMLGLQTSARNKILAGSIDAFSTDTLYVKFEKVFK